MSTRWAVVGLARVRARWFTDVAAWSNAGRVPVDFSKCVSTAEALARLDSIRGTSALLVESGAPGVERDLFDRARDRGVPTIVVDTLDDGTDWCQLGAAAVLPGRFDAATLVELLGTHARPVAAAPTFEEVVDVPATEARGAMVAVLGVNGSGTSTVAMAIAQGLASGGSEVLLADLVRCGDQAMYHDAGDVVPGFQELVEAHRAATPDDRRVLDLLFAVERRGYGLLLGLRRHRDWTAFAPRAVEASLASLRRLFDVVVADLDRELDGEAETGSLDIEERNAPTRFAVRDATAVVTVGDPSIRGLHQLLHLQRDLGEFGVAPDRLVTVLNRAPRSPRKRAELTAALATLTPTPSPLSPVFLPERRGLDTLHSTGDPLPAQLVRPCTVAIEAVLRGSVAAQATAPSRIDTPSAVITAEVSAT